MKYYDILWNIMKYSQIPFGSWNVSFKVEHLLVEVILPMLKLCARSPPIKQDWNGKHWLSWTSSISPPRGICQATLCHVCNVHHPISDITCLPCLSCASHDRKRLLEIISEMRRQSFGKVLGTWWRLHEATIFLQQTVSISLWCARFLCFLSVVQYCCILLFSLYELVVPLIRASSRWSSIRRAGRYCSGICRTLWVVTPLQPLHRKKWLWFSYVLMSWAILHCCILTKYDKPFWSFLYVGWGCVCHQVLQLPHRVGEQKNWLEWANVGPFGKSSLGLLESWMARDGQSW